jgi:hypothetical protein
VLYWLQRDSGTLDTFVANRVAEIQELSKGIVWRHVPTDANPADLVSRGTDINEIVSSLWFEGPSFLKLEEDQWPQLHLVEIASEIKSSEDKKSAVVCTLAEVEPNCFIELINRHSNFQKIDSHNGLCASILLQRAQIRFTRCVGIRKKYFISKTDRRSTKHIVQK